MKKAGFVLCTLILGVIIQMYGQNTVKIGIIADVHGEKERLKEFIDQAQDENLDFIIQLGDLSSGKKEETEEMLAIWEKYPGKKYHVLGNHEFDYSTKEEMVKRQEMPGNYYSFDNGDFHFIVLDCNFIKKDGVFIDHGNANYYIDKEYRDLINPEQVEWLAKDIRETEKPVIIFSHQTFDDITIRGSNPVPNRAKVRKVIDEANRSGIKVIACFAGHDHLDHYNRINGVHFFSVNSAYGFKKSLELKDGIYAMVTFNNNERTISIKGTKTEFKKPPTDDDYKPYPKESIFPHISDRKVKY
ncbi:MAG: metallophosphoesterase [Bacteroidales bacterium]|jgi:predicted phosphodiesterase|nr:metallophosphoesterase [Bacteroidales bacterium]